jgi:hypothetical protein
MKDEIEKIFDNTLQQDWNYFEQKTITMRYQDRIIDETLHLFNNTIDSCYEDIRYCAVDNPTSNYSKTSSEIAKDILIIIKNKVRSNNDKTNI